MQVTFENVQEMKDSIIYMEEYNVREKYEEKELIHYHTATRCPSLRHGPVVAEDDAHFVKSRRSTVLFDDHIIGACWKTTPGEFETPKKFGWNYSDSEYVDYNDIVSRLLLTNVEDIIENLNKWGPAETH